MCVVFHSILAYIYNSHTNSHKKNMLGFCKLYIFLICSHTTFPFTFQCFSLGIESKTLPFSTQSQRGIPSYPNVSLSLNRRWTTCTIVMCVSERGSAHFVCVCVCVCVCVSHLNVHPGVLFLSENRARCQRRFWNFLVALYVCVCVCVCVFVYSTNYIYTSRMLTIVGERERSN